MATGSAETFEAQRRSLFGLAYRLLGLAADAEDVVQDAYLRWSGADQAAIANPAAWLAKTVTNLCLTRLGSARARREQYVGPWLPEPVLTADGALGPLDTAEQRDSVSFALLVLLERLTPAERAVFVLREAFGYAHAEIAQVLTISEAHSRQLHHRSRSRLRQARPRFAPRGGAWGDLVERFLTAAQDGDLQGLEQLLAADVTSWADGGGQVPAARRPVTGPARVARLYAGLVTKYVQAGGIEITLAEINGGPGILGRWDGAVRAALVIDVLNGQIHALRAVANPAKLGFVARQLDPALSHPALSHPGGLSGRNW